MKKDLRLTIEDFVTLARFISGASQDWADVKNNAHDQITTNINLYSAEYKATQAVTFGKYPLQFEVKLYANEVCFDHLYMEELEELFEMCVAEWNSLKVARAFQSKVDSKRNA
jgi:predicted nicotinamide N-methyase